MPINPYEPPQEEGTPVANGSVPLARIAEGWLAGGIVGCVLSWWFVPVHDYIPGDRICLCVIAACTVIGGAVARVVNSAPTPKNIDEQPLDNEQAKYRHKTKTHASQRNLADARGRVVRGNSR